MKKKILLMIQVRMGSKRLPKKAMLDLVGKPMIYRIIERVKRCKLPDDIVLITSKKKENNIFKKISKSLQVKIFFGSENNLVDRHLQAAKKFKGQIIVRVPGDNCLSEPVEIDKIIKHHLNQNRRSFTSNLTSIFKSGYPDGLGAEVFDYNTLKEISKKKISRLKKEHVSLNFFDYTKQKIINKNFCEVNTIKCPKAFSSPSLRLDVNNLNDYLFIKKIYEHLYKGNKFFSIKDTIRYLKKKKIL
jgi:spore coat polysaccharide biosynthesis protein SpsF